jgi:3-hydroxymyristoyl/3-hydroxydecanoyl-(acyl carrier protein) dehydratase
MISELHIADNHPAFAGHFPGLPILPGAVLLDEALVAMAQQRGLDLLDWQVSSVKFLETVGPGDPLRLEHDSPNDRTIRFTVRHGSRLIASGTLSAIAARAPVVDGA